MSKAHGLVPTLALTGLLTAPAAQAALFDFAALAADNERGAPSLEFEAGGIELTATGFSTDGSIPYNAYLDGPYVGRAGGLGVCKVLDGDECTPSNDDNLNHEEMLRLTFVQEVNIEQMLFRDAEHFASFDEDADFLISIDGGEYKPYPLVHEFNELLTGTIFEIIANGDGDELYLSQMTVSRLPFSVPEPASRGLLGLGLGVLGWHRRQRKVPA